ncbi:MAG: radical SAM protein [Candidatus Methanoperedens sp.]|nr:radical SAM protein [Candidatus Methanoperedens sp.]MCE8424513.1 radical SAM protein [Candidatus Methanoperedens sp.]MCE8426945.1 radical SAM protein [Candidatus Methanoperedens sp.]
MVNLLITTRCNRSCGYCFAKEKIYSSGGSASHTDITIHDLDRVLDFLAKTKSSSLQLAGGEPTIHPKFEEILIKILGKGIYVNVLSNALWNHEKNKLFSNISPTKVGFLLNIDHPGTYGPGDLERIEENLFALEGRGNVTLSFNIFEKVPQCEYIFDIVSKHSFTNIRLSFSMPVLFGKSRNIYLPIEDYSALTPFVMNFVRRAEASGVCVRMDNTVPLCMLSPDELGELLLKEVLDRRRNFTCFPAIDIGPDLSVWRCFGTSGLFNKRLEEFNSLNEVYEYYEMIFKPFKSKVFPMKKCYDCKYGREGLCQGGCLGFSTSKYMELNKMPVEITDEEIVYMKPKLSEEIEIRKYEIPDTSLILSLKNKEMLEINPLMEHLLNLFDGKRTIGEVMEIYAQKITQVGQNEDMLDGFLIDIASQEVIPTIRKLMDREFLINDDPDR